MNLISLSGGKDSTALALLAIERGATPLRFVFADTGHEHPWTYQYLTHLDRVLRDRCGVGVQWVRADFTARIAAKRDYVTNKWPAKGVPAATIERALAVLHPTDNPFLDLCLLKGRFPSTKARFCTQELKQRPIDALVLELLETHPTVWSWQGVRGDESRARAQLLEHEDLGGYGVHAYRPLLAWSAADVFAYLRSQGVAWNPLYERGMKRVGCMPCIMAGKHELREIARRYPEELDRVAQWERLVAEANKRHAATFFAANKTPGHVRGTVADDPQAAYGVEAVKDWVRTTRGGRQYDLMVAMDEPDDDAPLPCSSVYGLCE